MAQPELLRSVTLLSRKIDKILEQQSKLNERIATLVKENQELKIQHESDLKFLEKANKEIEFLKLSHRLASSPEALISARKKVSRLIRTIDSCILMLNEE